jgi:ankyrin repeat protein
LTGRPKGLHYIAIALAVLLTGAAGDRRSLTEAVKGGDKEALRTLLKQGAKVDAAEGDGTTALLWASYRDDLESADLLILAGASVNAANDLGATPLWAASQNGSPAMVRKLLKAGANPNLALLAGETPLMVASRAGSADVVGQLLAAGAHPNARGSRGQTALMWAVAEKHPEAVKVLLAGGADVQARSSTYNEVMAVSPHGLLEYNRSIPHGNETALMFVARVGDLESAKLLVAAGGDVNDSDAWGVTATVLAAHSGFGDTVEFLLEKGADPNLASPGFTALHEAIMRRDEKMVTTLLAYGADPNASLRTWTPTRRASNDFNFAPALVGATPFWLAARVTAPAIMRLLIERGADPLFVHHADYVNGESYERRQEVTTALMAAVGMGARTTAWFHPIAASVKRSLSKP